MRALGLRGVDLPVEAPARLRDVVRDSDLVLEHVDTVRGRSDLRPLVRYGIEAAGGRLVGTPGHAAQAADDKIELRHRLEEAGIGAPRFHVLARAGADPGLPFPVVVKRPFDHGSRGTALARSRAALRKMAARWLPGTGQLLVEEFIAGRELAVSAIEVRGRLVVLPVVEVDLGRRLTYEARLKWGRGPLPIRAAELSRVEAAKLAAQALRAFRVLGLAGYARLDVRLRQDGTPAVLEVNVRPSVEDGTEFRLSASLAGLGEEELLALLFAEAARRHGAAAILRRIGPVARRAERVLASAQVVVEGCSGGLGSRRRARRKP